jgi:hypothetical protein
MKSPETPPTALNQYSTLKNRFHDSGADDTLAGTAPALCVATDMPARDDVTFAITSLYLSLPVFKMFTITYLI